MMKLIGVCIVIFRLCRILEVEEINFYSFFVVVVEYIFLLEFVESVKIL